MKNSFRTETFDRMQYFYTTAHDPVIRARLGFAGRIDENALRRAVDRSAEVVPQVRLCFDQDRHGWADRGFSSAEIVKVVETEDDGESAASKLLLSTIKFFTGPQLRIFLVRGKDADTLCVVISHLVSDGAGFRQYLYLLAGLYSQCVGSAETAPLRPMDRSFRQVMRKFSRREKTEILSAPMNYPKQDPSMFLPLKEERGEPFLAERTLDAETMEAIKAYGKSRKATVNDLLMAAFGRAHCALSGCRTFVFPCPVDLRKYLPKGETGGITNLSSSYMCELTIRENEPFDVTLLSVSMQMSAQKNSIACLKGPWLLDWMNRLLPYSVFRKLFFQNFYIPIVSYTNLGVLDREQLRFGDAEPVDASLSTAVKHAPSFQVSASTFGGRCVLSSCVDYRGEDRKVAVSFLDKMAAELENLVV